MVATSPNANNDVNGDTLAVQIKSKQAGDSYGDVVTGILDDYRRRPGLFAQDMALVSDAFHEKGLLTNLTIVGIQGQDLVARDGKGNAVTVDAQGLDHTHLHDVTTTDTKEGNRSIQMGSDGSGSYALTKWDIGRDKNGRSFVGSWTIAQDILKARGIDNPTPNQEGNFIKELEAFNGKSLKDFKPGDIVKIPPAVKGGDQSEFGPERSEDGDRKLAADKQKREDNLEKTYESARNAFMFATSAGGTMSPGGLLNRADLDIALNNPNVSADLKGGLEFLRDAMDRQDPILSPYKNLIYLESLDKWKESSQKRISLET